MGGRGGRHYLGGSAVWRASELRSIGGSALFGLVAGGRPGIAAFWRRGQEAARFATSRRLR